MPALELYAPIPKASLKRAFVQEFEASVEPSPKRHRPSRPVIDWLHEIVPVSEQRPQSAPALLQSPRVDEVFRDEMRSARDDNESLDDTSRTDRSTNARIKPQDPRYRSVLGYNGVVMDTTGRKMSSKVRAFVDSTVLKPRTSPPLPSPILDETMKALDEWSHSTENVVNNLVNSAMFPIQRPGLGVGGNSAWPRSALPYDKDYGHAISTPRPDYHVGYTSGVESGFSARHARVIDHPYAQPYTRPGRGNILPFLSLELKSEATGGTLYTAENQAAGSGTYSLNSLLWLLDQANADKTNVVTFSIAATARLVILSVHWQSEEDKKYYMSYVKGYLTAERQQIQECHNAVKNILDHAMGEHQTRLKTALETLFPLSQQWSKHGFDEGDKTPGGDIRDPRRGGSNLSVSRSRTSSAMRSSNSVARETRSAPTPETSSSSRAECGRKQRQET